jgi:hypothetical protein
VEDRDDEQRDDESSDEGDDRPELLIKLQERKERHKERHPIARHEVLARLVGVVGGKRDALLGLTKLLQRLDDPGRRHAADPHAAIEVEDELVVATREGGEWHRR